MGTNHNQRETVRAYLLGILSGDESLALEQRYLADRAFFLWMKDSDRTLGNDINRTRHHIALPLRRRIDVYSAAFCLSPAQASPRATCIDW